MHYFALMSMTAEMIVSEALELPDTIRAFVAERLIESLDSDVTGDLSPEWKLEVEKRCGEVDKNMVTLIPSDDVFKRAYAGLS